MPLIKPRRTRGKPMVRRIVRLDRETNETLFAYAHFLGESTDYVLNGVIDTVLGELRSSGGPRTARRSCRRHPPTSLSAATPDVAQKLRRLLRNPAAVPSAALRVRAGASRHP